MKHLLILFLLPLSLNAKTLIPKAFTAHFEESLTSVATGKEKKTFGKIAYQYPAHIRYEVTRPEESIASFVSNGKTSWYYRPPFVKGEKGEVTIQKAQNLPLAKFLDSLQTGIENSKQYSSQYSGKSLTLAFNKAAEKDTKIKEVILEAAKEAKSVASLKEFEKMVLVKSDGQRLTYKFSDFNELPNLKPSDFEFTVPENTKITKE
jgi:outer membrane lipoprotein-sorting protein